MKHILAIVSVVMVGSLTGSTLNAGDGPDLIGELWQMDDATTLDAGQMDVRLTLGWVTANAPANLGDSDDDWFITPSLVWGARENLEVFARVPVWLGDGGDAGALQNGNADTTLGFTWRFMEPVDGMHAMALQGSIRVPTGDNSSGVDAEARLILTNNYDSGIRSHINGFVGSNNGHNDPDIRHFAWGVVLGLDGPLCSDGAVRWVADYMHRSSLHFGGTDTNLLELGWEWTMAAASKVGMSFQIGLDDNEDTPNFGAIISFAHSIMN